MDANICSKDQIMPCCRLDFDKGKISDVPNSARLDFDKGKISDVPNSAQEKPEAIDCMIIPNSECGPVANGNHSNSKIPFIGMEFSSENEAYQFYQAYAKATGFGTRIGRGHKDSSTGILLDRIFCCAREGKRAKDKRDFKVKRHRAETRCNCEAMMKINCRLTGKYRVVQFIADHNHELASPSKSFLFRSHRKISKAQEAEIDMAASCGITPKQTLEFMAKQTGGIESLGFIQTDCKNYLRSKRMKQERVGDTWTKGENQCRNDVGFLDMCGTDPKERMGFRYKDLYRLCTQLASKAAEEESAYEFVKKGIFKMLEEVDMMMERKKIEKEITTCNELGTISNAASNGGNDSSQLDI